MQLSEFRLYDARDFPIVRISGRGLPIGYGPQLVAEMDALLVTDKPFVIIALDSAENPDHDDQKTLMVWVKSHKSELSRLCKGFVSIEPDRAVRLLKRAQGAAIAMAFGLRMKIAADRSQAEALAKRLLKGEDPQEAEDE
jgi:hypothetical protein